jgi:hypothetical protein
MGKRMQRGLASDATREQSPIFRCVYGDRLFCPMRAEGLTANYGRQGKLERLVRTWALAMQKNLREYLSSLWDRFDKRRISDRLRRKSAYFYMVHTHKSSLITTPNMQAIYSPHWASRPIASSFNRLQEVSHEPGIDDEFH